MCNYSPSSSFVCVFPTPMAGFLRYVVWKLIPMKITYCSTNLHHFDTFASIQITAIKHFGWVGFDFGPRIIHPCLGTVLSPLPSVYIPWLHIKRCYSRELQIGIELSWVLYAGARGVIRGLGRKRSPWLLSSPNYCEQSSLSVFTCVHTPLSFQISQTTKSTWISERLNTILCDTKV